MQLSAKTDYACRALLELALHWPNKEPIQLDTIAKRQTIPLNFLNQIMLLLKQLGYTESVRGNCGGYLLARHPKDMTLGLLVQQFGTEDILPNTDDNHNVISQIWKRTNQKIFDDLNAVTFDDLVTKQRLFDKTVMFEI